MRLDPRPVAKRTRSRTEAELSRKARKAKSRDESSNETRRENLRPDSSNLVVLDSSEDDVIITGDYDENDNMEGKDVISVDDDAGRDGDTEDNGGDGFTVGNVKIEDSETESDDFDGKRSVEVEIGESNDRLGFSRNKSKGKEVSQPSRLRKENTIQLSFDSEKDGDDSDSDRVGLTRKKSKGTEILQHCRLRKENTSQFRFDGEKHGDDSGSDKAGLTRKKSKGKEVLQPCRLRKENTSQLSFDGKKDGDDSGSDGVGLTSKKSKGKEVLQPCGLRKKSTSQLSFDGEKERGDRCSDNDNSDSPEMESFSDKEDDDYLDDEDSGTESSKSSENISSEEEMEEEGDDEEVVPVKKVRQEKEMGEQEDSDEEAIYVDELNSKEESGQEENNMEAGKGLRLKRKKGKRNEFLFDPSNGSKDDSDGRDGYASFHAGQKPKIMANHAMPDRTSEPVKERMKPKTVHRPLDVKEPADDDVVICPSDEESHNYGKRIGSPNGKPWSGEGIRLQEGVKDVQRANKSTKRRRTRSHKEQDIVNILGHSILDQADVPFEEKDELVKEPSQQTLPLKFTLFDVKEPAPPEKSEEEKELEKLWAEFDLVLWSLNSTNNPPVGDAVETYPEVDVDTATLCRQGRHQCILDEEIGIKCKYCSFVELEIRHCVAPFSTDPWGRSARRDRAKKQHIFDGTHYHDAGCDSHPDRDSSNHARGKVWDIIPGIGKGLHEHQREGFEFLWKNIAGGIYLDKLKEAKSSNDGRGCIISHAPGTGKTRLAIVFLQTYMKLYPSCRPVLIAPSSMLHSWEAEFLKWGVDIPFHNLNKDKFSFKENQAAMNFLRKVKPGQCSSNSIRMIKLYSWKKETSILSISYGLFEKLAGEDKGKKKGRHMTEDDQVRKALLELPGLLVLDEGHTPRNKQSLIWKALSRVRTQRRIMLSGTPFQNNFDELYNTLYLVNPKFADEISSKHKRAFHKKPNHKECAARENWFSLTNPLGKVIGDGQEDPRLQEVRDVIRPFVHVHKGTILQEKLPGLRESLLILEPGAMQRRLLDGIQKMKNQLAFNLDNWVSLVSVHPSLLKKSTETEQLVRDWDKIAKLKTNPNASVKTHFLMELICLSEARNEKVLVFCQFLPPLKLIMKQLKSQFGWTKENEVLYMHGQLRTSKRQSLIKHFNDPQSRSRVLLASTRACCEGISLVGASRVVLLDVVWNPAVETQAISRAYRLGQEKIVYVYHLVTSGEEEKYCRQVRKERLSELVFYSADNAGSHKKFSSDISDDMKDKLLEAMVEHERLKYMFKKIIYEPKDSNLVKSFGLTNL